MIRAFLKFVVSPVVEHLGSHLEKTSGATAKLGHNPKRLGCMKGQEGTAVTNLYPSGKIRIGDSEYDAIAEREGIESGSPVRVLGSKCHSFIVEKAGPNQE